MVLTQCDWTVNFGLMQVLARGARVFRLDRILDATALLPAKLL
ncbi:hypothetical protein [Streptomyces sp. NPDC047968]